MQKFLFKTLTTLDWFRLTATTFNFTSGDLWLTRRWFSSFWKRCVD